MTLARKRGRPLATPAEPLEVVFVLQFVDRFIATRSEFRSSVALTGSRDFTKLRFLAKASRCRSGLWNRCNCFVNECVPRASAEQIEGPAKFFHGDAEFALKAEEQQEKQQAEQLP